MDTIKNFHDEPFKFLSNFTPSPFSFRGITYPTVEHYYQAMKTEDVAVHAYFAGLHSAGLVKKLGRTVAMRVNWDAVKEDVMRHGLRKKFKIIELREALLATGDAVLEEGNWWRDLYWGIDLKTGQGQNRLGVLLMEVRDEIQATQL